MCLQVVVAALYYNPPVLLEMLQKPLANTNSTILAHFIKQWLDDADCFLGSVRQSVGWCLTSLFSTNIWLYQGRKVMGGQLSLPSIGRPAIY